MDEEGINQGIQTASKVVGGLSFTTAATSSWWAMSVPWSDIAIIVSAVGGFFFSVPEANATVHWWQTLYEGPLDLPLTE